MVSLGSVRADGIDAIPAGLRIAAYPVVDVSAEPFDGDPGDSGASLLRGVLEARTAGSRASYPPARTACARARWSRNGADDVADA